MSRIRGKERAVVLLVCIVVLGILVSGCHSLVQDDGPDRSAVDLEIGGKDRLFGLKLFSGTTKTRVVTNEHEETLDAQPTPAEYWLYNSLIEKGQELLAAQSMKENTDAANATKVKATLIRKGSRSGNLDEDVLTFLSQ